jgi:hypothetical protein
MLSNAIEPLNDWIKTNRLQNFNPDKTKLVKLSDGITYLGCHAAQTGPRSEPLQFFPTGKRKWKFVRGLRRLVKMPHDPRFIKPHPMSPLLPNPSIQSELASINSLFGGLVHSESYQFRRKALSRFEHDFNPTPLPPELDPGSWPLYQMKKGYRALR